MEDLIKTINQLDLNNIFRTLQPTTAEHTFFPNVHEAFVKIDHILGHKQDWTNLKGLKDMFSDHNVIKLEINRKCNENHQI